MAITLLTLKNRLEAAVSARNGVPSAEQYEQAIKDAVADFSDHLPLEQMTEIAVQDGTATYALPEDFLRMVRFESIQSNDGRVLVTESGLIPVSSSFEERYTIAGHQLTIHPTPAYSTTRHLWYKAAYVLDEESETYPNLVAWMARLVLLKAQAFALQLQANRAAQEAWSYGIGEERVDKKSLAKSLAERAKEAEDAYGLAVTLKKQGWPLGLRAYRQ